MGSIRPFRQEDIPQIIELNKKLFPGSAGLSRESQEFRFREICLHNPWFDERITSLVHEESSGQISGFIGIIPRRVAFNGTSLTLAVGQHLMVDRATLAGLQLFKAFISGPQDISMADMAADVTMKLWERIGGSTSYTHSIFWRKPLRPLSTAVAYMKRNSSNSALATFLRPIAPGVDAMINRKAIAPAHIARPSSRGEELTIDTILSEFPNYSEGRLLKPLYDKASLAWLFDILSREHRFGSLRKIHVKSSDGTSLGWYIYFMNEGGRSELLQLAGTRASAGEILTHLFYDAWEHGSQELAGRVDPLFMKEFADRYCFFAPGSAWVLIHTKFPDVLHAVNSGKVFLSRLEGDLWFF